MSDKPTYPKEAAIGSAAAKDAAAEAGDETQPQPEKGGDDRRRTYVRAGVAVGIGSAAIVAALLYAGRGKREGGKEGG